MKTKNIKHYLLGCLVYCGIAAAPATLVSCSDDDFTGDPDKDWAGTTTFFEPTDAQGFGTYYTPAVGRVGDPMPFYDQKAGDFKVLYLQEFINNMTSTSRMPPSARAVPTRRTEHTTSTTLVTTATARTARW